MSSIKALTNEVVEATDCRSEAAAFMLGLLHGSGLTGRDASTSLINYLNTPLHSQPSSDGIRAAAILKEHQL